jgi:hypothetical protein
MTDKPKRKRSETLVSSDKRRLRWLTLLYSLFLVPYLFNILPLLAISIAFAVVFSIFWISGYLMKLVGQMQENLLTYLIMSVIGIVSNLVAWLLFTAIAWIGLILWQNFLSHYIPSLSIYTLERISSILMMTSPILSIVFAVELYIQITEFMNPFPHRTTDTEKQKNDYRSSLSNELEEPDIPLELLAESDSAKQQIK